MKKTRKWLTPVAFVCTLAIVVAIMAVPALLFAAEDKALLSEPQSRQRTGGVLAPEGEDLYLVRTMHARNALLHNEGAAAGYQPQPAKPEELRPALAAKLDGMAKAGVLPAALCSQLAVLLEHGATSFQYAVDGADFVQVQCVFGEEEPWQMMGMESEPRTGRVVNFWLIARGGRPGIAFAVDDAAAAMDAYKGWLGLDSLDDWQAAEEGYYDTSLVSQKAMMQLYLLVAGHTLSLGMVPTGVFEVQGTP